MPRDTSSRAIPGVSLQKRGAAWLFMRAGTPIPTPSHALPRFSAFVRIRVSTVSHCELMSRSIFARDHVAPTEFAQTHSCEHGLVRRPWRARGHRCSAERAVGGMPRERQMGKCTAGWRHGLGMGVPKPRVRTNDPEVRLPGVPTGTRAERRCLRVRGRAQRILANELVSPQSIF
jgi:hypothetical protein